MRQIIVKQHLLIGLSLLLLGFTSLSSYAAEQTSAPLTPSLTQSFHTDLMTGAAVVNIPITVPPGRKGIQPNIALSYSSSSANGICGVGWQLELGAIQRNTKNGAPNYNGADSFIANINNASIELVDIGGGEYRAKQEGAFLKFSFNGAIWQVKDKTGVVYFFGRDESSRQQAGERIFSWHLDKIVDLHANFLTISYLKDQNQIYPEQIQYTGKEGTDAPANSVEFVYEPRDDIPSNYRANFEVKTEKRLSAIEVKANNERARTYLFSYAYSPDTARSILTSITQYGSDGITALPPLTFEYQSGARIEN